MYNYIYIGKIKRIKYPEDRIEESSIEAVV